MKIITAILVMVLPFNALANSELYTSRRPSAQLLVLELGQLGMWGAAVRQGDRRVDIGLFSDSLSRTMSASPSALVKVRAFKRSHLIGASLFAGGTVLLLGELVAVNVMSHESNRDNAAVHLGVLASSVAFNIAAAIFFNSALQDLSASVGIYNAEYVDGLSRNEVPPAF